MFFSLLSFPPHCPLHCLCHWLLLLTNTTIAYLIWKAYIVAFWIWIWMTSCMYAWKGITLYLLFLCFIWSFHLRMTCKPLHLFISYRNCVFNLVTTVLIFSYSLHLYLLWHSLLFVKFIVLASSVPPKKLIIIIIKSLTFFSMMKFDWCISGYILRSRSLLALIILYKASLGCGNFTICIEEISW